MGDETNKNISAGADMAEGFTEGMDDANGFRLRLYAMFFNI